MDVSGQDIYSELKTLARAYMRRERRNHTLSPTDLFHEAYCRVYPRISHGVERIHEVRAMFAVTMRRVLIDHARKRTRRQRILFPVCMSVEECLNPTDLGPDHHELELLELLNRALEAMVEKYPAHAKIVELKVFGGETIQSCAELLGISEATVQRRWRFSKAWLIREIKRIERDQDQNGS